MNTNGWRWGATLSHHPLNDFCTCCWVRAEGGRKVDSPWSLAWSPRAKPWGRLSCHPAYGYQTSQEEIRDQFHEVYMLRRLSGPLPFWPKWMEEASRDILSSLRSHLWKRRGIQRLEEELWGATVPILQPSHQTKAHPQTQGRDYLHDKALQVAREGHQWLLEAAHVLELNIESWVGEPTEPNASAPTAADTPGVDSKKGVPGPQTPIGWGGM